MTIKIDELEHYCNSPEVQLQNVQQAFEQIISLTQDDPTYRPRLAVFDDSRDLTFAVASRPYDGASDYKSAIAEMLYSFQALDAHSCILVLDSHIKDNDDVVGDCLNLYFMSSINCHVVQLMYSFEDDDIKWHEDKHRFSQIDLKDHDSVSQEMIEMLFVFTHLDHPPFSSQELFSFYSAQNYQFRSFKDLNVTYVDFLNSTN